MDCAALGTLLLANTTEAVQLVTVAGQSVVVAAGTTVQLACSGTVEVITQDPGLLVSVLGSGLPVMVTEGVLGLAAVVGGGLIGMALIWAFK